MSEQTDDSYEGDPSVLDDVLALWNDTHPADQRHAVDDEMCDFWTALIDYQEDVWLEEQERSNPLTRLS